MKKKKTSHKKYLSACLLLPPVLLLIMVGTLIFPGWNLGPFGKTLESQIERRIPGLEFAMEKGTLRLKRGFLLRVEAGSVRMAQKGGKPTLSLEHISVDFPLRRLLSLRILPRLMTLRGLRIWVETDERNALVIPPWILDLIGGEEMPEDPAPDWRDLRLGDIPLIWKLEDGEFFRIAIEDYAALLTRGEKEAAFHLPTLMVGFRGNPEGVDVDWHTAGMEGERLVSGRMQVNVLEEQIDWENQLNLPLTPDLASWLETGFPFLPIPSFLETEVQLRSLGRLDLPETRMEAQGELVLLEGSVLLPGDQGLRLDIPRISMEFESDLSHAGGIPRMRSNLLLRLGEEERASVIGLAATIDGDDDLINVSSAGGLSHVEDILALLPPHLRPVGIEGDFRWEASLETLYSQPETVRIGQVALSSGGMEIRFEGHPDKTIRLESFSLAGRAEHSGSEIHLDPFSLTAGPVSIRGNGLRWNRASPEAAGQGFIRLEPLKVSDLLAELPDGFLELDPDVRDWLETLQIERLELGIELHGGETEHFPLERIRLTPEWKLLVAGRELTGGGFLEGTLSNRVAGLEISLAEFNPSGMNLPWFADFGELDSGIRAFLRGRYAQNGDDNLIRLEIRAEPGVFRPGPELNDVLSGPLEFGGADIEFGLKGRESWEGEGRLKTSGAPGAMKADWRVYPFAWDTLGTGPVTAKVQWDVQPAASSALLDLLHPSLRADLPLGPEIWPQLDLLGFSGTCRLGTTGAEDLTAVEVRDLAARLAIRTGLERLEIELAQENGSTDELRFLWNTNRWNIGATGLTLGEVLPIPIAALHLPLSFEGDIRLPSMKHDQERETLLDGLKVLVSFRMEDGHVAPNRFLTKPLDVSLLTGSADLHPMDLTILEFDARLVSPVGVLAPRARDLAMFNGSPTGTLGLEITDLDLGALAGLIPPGAMSEPGLPWLEETRVRGSIPRAEFLATLATPRAEDRLPGISHFSIDIAGGPVNLEQPLLSTLTVNSFGISGDSESLTMSLQETGVPAAWIDALRVEILEPLTAGPQVRVEGGFRVDLAESGTLLDRPEWRKHLPDWLTPHGWRGKAQSSLTLNGIWHQTPALADWALDQDLIMEGVWLPLPEGPVGFGEVNQRTRIKWDGGVLNVSFHGGIHDLEIEDLASGSVPVSGTITASRDGPLVGRADFDLTDWETRIGDFSNNKQRGSPASLGLGLSLPRLWTPSGDREFTFDFHTRNLLFDRLDLRAESRLPPDFTGDWRELETVHLSLHGMHDSDLSLSMDRSPGGVRRIVGRSRDFNVGPGIALLEPFLLKLLNGEETTAPGPLETMPGGHAAFDPVGHSQDPLPPMEIDLHFERIHLGDIRTVGPMRADGSWVNGLPRDARLSLDDGRDNLSLEVQPSGSDLLLDLRLSNLGEWLETAVTPIRLLNSETARGHPTLQTLEGIPSYVGKGDLRCKGRLGFQPDFFLDIEGLNLEGLVLKAEIAFLNRIAALVNRRVVLLVPFKEFRVGNINLNQREAGARDVFMDGPINLAFEKAHYQIPTGEVHVEGKVLGVSFEVTGIHPDLRFYLKERSQFIRALTVEDDFLW